MIRYYLTIILCIFFLYTDAQTNRALVVGISKYPIGSGWEEIHTAGDCRLLQHLLSKHNFQDKNKVLLTDSMATKSNILIRLGQLLHETNSGDYLYVHFSCHGQQMMDSNGDEDDGLDEALIPYDARFWYSPGKYVGKNHLRDDEIGEWLYKLRKKAGEKGNVTLVMDACHSGTANRENEDEDYIRGTSYIFAPEDYIPSPGKHQELSLRLKKEKNLAPTNVFSACIPEEINYEFYDTINNNYYGLLTYAFCQTVSKTSEKSNMEAFYTELKKTMNQLRKNKKRMQTPYLECSDPKATFRIGLK